MNYTTPLEEAIYFAEFYGDRAKRLENTPERFSFSAANRSNALEDRIIAAKRWIQAAGLAPDRQQEFRSREAAQY